MSSPPPPPRGCLVSLWFMLTSYSVGPHASLRFPVETALTRFPPCGPPARSPLSLVSYVGIAMSTLYPHSLCTCGCAFRSVCLESAQSLSLKDTFASLAIIFTLLFPGLLFVFPFVCQFTEELYYFLTDFSCHSVLGGTGQASGE